MRHRVRAQRLHADNRQFQVGVTAIDQRHVLRAHPKQDLPSGIGHGGVAWLDRLAARKDLLAGLARHAGWQFDGVDPSAQMLETARVATVAHADRVQLHEGTIDVAPDGPFDGATCLLTFHFIPLGQRLETLAQLHRRLLPGAPLVLATEHRVNGKGEGKAPPRGTSPAIPTISALFDEGEETPAPPADRFSRFLDEAAPADLAAAIDAAAAYLTHVEGLEDFPRQQLMRLIAPVEGAQDREAVMRSFGILLRDERLRRSRRGQFESGARSGFVEVARRFGQSA